jgi:hypothetical protein
MYIILKTLKLFSITSGLKEKRSILQCYNTPRIHEAYCNIEEMVLVADDELMTCYAVS